MRYAALRRRLPRFLSRHILHFEACVEDAVSAFASELADSALVLDAGAGEARHAEPFERHRYIAVDLAVGDPQWNYGRLDCIADLSALPFRPGSFDGCLNIVTLEHVREPAGVLKQIATALAAGGRLLLVVPHQWEVHQAPHDYYRFTRYGVRRLLETAGFTAIRILPAGGFFHLLSRRLLNGLQFFSGVWLIPAAAFLVPPALLLPLFDFLDRDRDFTLGYICTAQKPS